MRYPKEGDQFIPAEPISDRLPGIDAEQLTRQALDECGTLPAIITPMGLDISKAIIRLAVLAERRRVLARVDELMALCSPGVGAAALDCLRSWVTHAGITQEEAVRKALGGSHLDEYDQPITVDAFKKAQDIVFREGQAFADDICARAIKLREVQ